MQLLKLIGFDADRWSILDRRQHPDQLERQFQQGEPDQAWVTDITYIRMHEGWLYLDAVLDLHSRAVVCWSMGALS